MTNYENPMPGNVLRIADFGTDYKVGDFEREVTADITKANIITSEVENTNGMVHRPILDIDLPITMLQSSDLSHRHLYISKPVSRGDYFKFLQAAADAGILEQGYVYASIKRGYTAVRLPWIKKQAGEVTDRFI